MAARTPHPFPTVDVPDHAHYTIGSVILAIGITGMVGNFLVIYAFSRSRSLRTPANMFIINLAVTDLLMCVTQAPVFFVSSMHKRWIFGEKACELYAFCGALFGICSMVTLTVIALDRYVVITRPLTSIGVLSRKRALVVLAAAWTYSLGWSLPPFFGWSAYVPEGLLTSCTWDYVTFTPSVRAYTMLLFVFVFFVPLLVIVCCYVSIFRAVRRTDKAVGKMSGTGVKTFHRLQNEWKMAKIALIVILLYVVSWAPYSTVALTAFAGYTRRARAQTLRVERKSERAERVTWWRSASVRLLRRYADMLTPYMNSVPAVIAKASAIHNPVIYAITHPKYRVALAKYIPCLGALLCVRPTDLRSAGGSFASTRRSTVTSQSSDISAHFRRHSKSRLSSVSDSESGLMDTEADLPSLSSRPASRQVSGDIGGDTAEFPEFKPSSSFKGKMKNHDSGIFERTSFDTDISTIGVSERGSAYSADAHASRGALNRIPSIVVTSESSPFLPIGRSASRSARAKATYCGTGAGSG
ncbi:melanopsin-A-like isoform X3 [Phyllopteryx taeniolatus]|nr:melanopsin-A-like isoform X3 [Phyllopteryx taeniolatus]